MSQDTSVRQVKLIKAADPSVSKQGLQNIEAISAETCHSRGLWLGIITIPPGARATPHLHEDHETAIYVLQGSGRMWYGEQLEECISFAAGDFLYIPEGMPHLPMNESASEPAIAIAARTDPNEQESVVLLHELEALVD